MLNAILFGAFVATGGFVYALGRVVLRMQRNPVRERLTAAVGRNLALVGGPLPGPVEAPMPSDVRRLSEVDREIRQAGWYRPWASRDFHSLRNAMVIFVMITAGGAAVAFGPEHPVLVRRAVLLGLGAIGLAWSVPRLYLRQKARSRVARIRRALPDALDLLTMSLTGGMSLPDAFAHVSRDIFHAHPDLAVELIIIREQTEMRSAELAFAQFAQRTGAPEVKALATLITQGQKLGTDVANSIREYADGLRLRRRQDADERSNKAGVKMLFPLTMCLLPSVFIILWGPSVLELWRFLSQFQGGQP